MIRFAIFVDGSNLFGLSKKLNFQVLNYEAFYKFIFEQGSSVWKKGTVLSGNNSSPAFRLLRTFWYVVGSIDYLNTADAKLQAFFRDIFDKNKDLKRTYLALAEQANPGRAKNELALEAWQLCFQECKSYYENKKENIEGMRRFYHSVRTTTDFIDIIECGHWKVDFLYKYVMEKGVDTQLAVDIVTLADFYDVALLISGDADSIPSVNYVKKLGKQVGIVEFVKGHLSENYEQQFSKRLGAACDFVVQIYESDLQQNGLSRQLKSGEDIILTKE